MMEINLFQPQGDWNKLTSVTDSGHTFLSAFEYNEIIYFIRKLSDRNKFIQFTVNEFIPNIVSLE